MELNKLFDKFCFANQIQISNFTFLMVDRKEFHPRRTRPPTHSFAGALLCSTAEHYIILIQNKFLSPIKIGKEKENKVFVAKVASHIYVENKIYNN